MKEEKNSITHSSNGLSKQLYDEMLNPTIDLGVNYSEVYLDDLIENEALQEIPLVKSIVGLVKAGISVNQFFFAKKLLTFIQQFNTGTIDPEKKLKFQNKINSDDKYRKKVCEQVMVFVDRFLEVEKAKISANLFKAFVEEKITYDQFVSINISLEKLHPQGYPFFLILEKQNYEVGHEFEGDRDFESEGLLLSSDLAVEISDWWSGIRLKDEGKLLYELAIKPLLNK